MVNVIRTSILVCSVATLVWTKAVPGHQQGATSFVYRRDNNGPATYVQIGAEALPEYQQKLLENAPIPLAVAPLQAVTPVSATHAVNSYGVVHAHQPTTKSPVDDESDRSDSVDDGAQYDDNTSGENDEDRVNNDSEEHFDDYNVGKVSNENDEFFAGGFSDLDDVIGRGSKSDTGHNKIDSHSHVRSDGNDYSAEKHSSHGEKGSKDYNTQNKFHNGKKGEHSSEGHKSYFSKADSDEDSKLDETKKYGSEGEIIKGFKAGDFGDKERHSKSSNSDGFHDVYHKDEYKKNKEFYDEADERGHFNKHKEEASKHGLRDSDLTNKGSKYSASSQDSHGKKGFNEGGRHHSSDKGYNRKDGHDDYFNNFEDFSKKAGNSNARKHNHRNNS